MTFCGLAGRLEPVGDGLPEADQLWVWRSNARLTRGPDRAEDASLLTLACEVAEFYHGRQPLYFRELPGKALEVAWLELAADDSLLVFFRPAETPRHAARA